MAERDDLLRIDATGTVHPVGRTASQELRQRIGEWSLHPSPKDAIILRRHADGVRPLKVAGEIRAPGALYDVVGLIAQAAWTGELVVLSGKSVRQIYFESANVIDATTNVPDERLGETLYRFGVITREQLEQAVAAAAKGGKRLGETAIDLDFVTREEIYPMMARQVEEVFFHAMHVGDGTFYFFEGFEEKNVLRRQTLNAGGLLMEGARRMDEMKFFRQRIPNDSFIPVPTSSRNLPPDDLREIYDQCDGKRSVAEIGRRIGQLEFEVTRGVFQLISGGYVQIAAPRPEGPQAIVGMFNPALAEIHKRCDAVGKLAELRDGLQRFASGTGIYDALFMGAGPLADGTLDGDRVGNNLVALAGDDPDTWLAQQLYDYVGFALFHAGSLLPREGESSLNAAVAAILKPLRQAEVGPPASRRSQVDPVEAR